jgi:hypothetical protein
MAEEFHKKLGIPIVIGIDSDYEIRDDAAADFSKEFYNYLLQGYSPKRAFKIAQYLIMT